MSQTIERQAPEAKGSRGFLRHLFGWSINRARWPAEVASRKARMSTYDRAAGGCREVGAESTRPPVAVR